MGIRGATAGCATPSSRLYDEANEENVTDFLAFSTANSVLDPQLLRGRAHQCARGAHRADGRDVGCDQRHLARTKRYGNGPTSREELSRFLRWVQESSLRFDGSAYRTMLRNDAYWFSRLGLYLERADNTARILDVKYHLLLPDERTASAARSIISSGRRSCARCRR